LIDEDAGRALGLSRPQIAFPSPHPHEAQPVEIDVAVMALADMPEQHRLAEIIVRGLGKRAGARNGAAAVVEPVADNAPVGTLGHVASPDASIRPPLWICDPGHAICGNSNQAPAAIKTIPAARAIHRPKGVSFSRSTSSARSAIHSTFMTPPTNNSAISTQQQPTQ